MKLCKYMLALFAVVSLNGCATMMGEKEPEGISATDCFSSGGIIDSSSGASMCVKGDEEPTPIL